MDNKRFHPTFPRGTTGYNSASRSGAKSFTAEDPRSPSPWNGLTIKGTISKDNTAGEASKQAQLLASFGRKLQQSFSPSFPRVTAAAPTAGSRKKNDPSMISLSNPQTGVVPSISSRGSRGSIGTKATSQSGISDPKDSRIIDQSSAKHDIPYRVEYFPRDIPENVASGMFMAKLLSRRPDFYDASGFGSENSGSDSDDPDPSG
ncbi:hypothetical protein B0H63DRAFT_520921 [Podospora didyma]|uniref:Uncharacterized protein n=1 Tax=Podospora didyma TaxID=330526 RepID=A0AAE0NSE8_9PEZI|nr:hypothetical protein B0H63DRAFT_520921 [Podospora didyma]